MIIEPLARYNQDGEMIPFLAKEVPTVANGGVSSDLTSITWTLRDDIVWSDGTPFTSADVKFTADYCMHPEGGCAQMSKFGGVTIHPWISRLSKEDLYFISFTSLKFFNSNKFSFRFVNLNLEPLLPTARSEGL